MTPTEDGRAWKKHCWYFCTCWCYPSLNHLQLVNWILMMRVPYWWAILQIWSDHNKIGIGYGVFFARPHTASQKPQHTVRSCRYGFSMTMTTVSQYMYQDILCCLAALGCGLSVDSCIWWGCMIKQAKHTTLLRTECMPYFVFHSSSILRSSWSASKFEMPLICLYTMKSSVKSFEFEVILSEQKEEHRP